MPASQLRLESGMLAVDTNVIVRILVGDHPDQTARARIAVEANPIWVPTTVLLETEWVLRNVYRYERARLAEAIEAFIGLPTVTVEHPDRAAAALAALRAGADFADALHLASAVGQDAFLTFDVKLARAASPGSVEVRIP